MSEDQRNSWGSGDARSPTIAPEDDPKILFNGAVIGINFRSASGGAVVKVERSCSVAQILTGPDAILEDEYQIRWIHLPVNCMSWVEELMEKLQDEKSVQESEASTERDNSPNFKGILHDDVWKNTFHGRQSTTIHSRFMRLLCARYSSRLAEPEDPESDDSDSIHQTADVLSLYLPFLHWEMYNGWKERQQHIARMKDLALRDEQCQCIHERKQQSSPEIYRNELLLHQQLFHPKPLHDRRTLDQSYFYNLRKVAHRDEDQVIGQHTWRYDNEQQDGERKMMMVDQLWMWLMGGDTVITCFPETGTGKRKEADVFQQILENLKPSVGQGTKSLNGLIALIINHCTGVFHRRDIHRDLEFFEFFADEIGTAKSEVEDLFASFHATSQSIEYLWVDPTISPTGMSRELDRLFSIREEISLLKRVEKIISDLQKIDYLCSQQVDVLHNLLKSSTSSRSSRSLTDLVETVKHRRRTWSEMASTAQSTHDALHSLLDLKQRQSNVSEARTCRYQVEISARQGRSIMLLTVVTIFFLPVSVIAAIFGMNAEEINSGKFHFSTISAIMFPVSFAIASLSLGLAFNEASRDLITAVCRGLYSSLSVMKGESKVSGQFLPG